MPVTYPPIAKTAIWPKVKIPATPKTRFHCVTTAAQIKNKQIWPKIYLPAPKTGKIIVKPGEKINYLNAKKLFNEGLKEIFVAIEAL